MLLSQRVCLCRNPSNIYLLWRNLSSRVSIQYLEKPEGEDKSYQYKIHPLPWTQPNSSKSDVLVHSKEYTDSSKRCGAFAIKVGMTNIYDDWGERHAIIEEKKNGYSALQVGAGEAKLKNVKKSMLGLFNKAEVPPKRKIGEFRVSPDGTLPVGFRIRATHFVPGQLIDVQGVTKGKGFQGAMKRWNFKGQRASHGVSKTHRHIGSTGQCQDPGRVFKGKKMPGHMGAVKRTVQCLKVLRIDTQRDLLYIKGHVPGCKGNFVRIQDAKKRPEFPTLPPFPSYVPNPNDELPFELDAPLKEMDPMHYMG